MQNKKQKLIFLSLSLLILASAVFGLQALAQGADLGLSDTSGNLQNILSSAGYKTTVGNSDTLNVTIALFLNLLLGLVGVVFVGLAVYSGIQWMIAGGEEDQVRTAQGRLRNASIGIVIVLLAFVGTKAVFNFFYEQTGGRQNSTWGAGTSCGTDDDCLSALGYGYDCVAGTCQLAGEANGRRCEKNADCPTEAPICQQFGNISDDTNGVVNFQGWSYCSCKSAEIPNACEGTSLPYCIDIAGAGSECRKCATDANCQGGDICRAEDHTCQRCAVLPESSTFYDDCSDHDKCLWNTQESKCVLR